MRIIHTLDTRIPTNQATASIDYGFKDTPVAFGMKPPAPVFLNARPYRT